MVTTSCGRRKVLAGYGREAAEQLVASPQYIDVLALALDQLRRINGVQRFARANRIARRVHADTPDPAIGFGADIDQRRLIDDNLAVGVYLPTQWLLPGLGQADAEPLDGRRVHRDAGFRVLPSARGAHQVHTADRAVSRVVLNDMRVHGADPHAVGGGGFGARDRRVRRFDQVHAADRTAARVVLHDLGMHGADPCAVTGGGRGDGCQAVRWRVAVANINQAGQRQAQRHGDSDQSGDFHTLLNQPIVTRSAHGC
jgi:hypothetical protein